MRSIAFTNRKGGVGKSSCVLHLGIRFAQMGLRTLLIDVDPQASLSQGLLGRDALEIDPGETLAGLYDCVGIPFANLIRAGVRENLSLVVGHERMDHFNLPDPWSTGSVQFALRDALADVAAGFDVCLMDNPPTVNLCGWSGLVAAHGVVVPAQLEDFSIQGVSAVLATVDQVRDVANPDLRLLGVLPTMVNKRFAIHASYAANAAEAYGPDLFADAIPAATDYKVAVTLRQGITEYKPRGDASKAVVRVGDEVLARFDARCVKPAKVKRTGRGIA